MKTGFVQKWLLGLGLVLLAPLVGAWEVDVYGGFAKGFAVQKQTTGDDTTDSAEKAYLGSRFLGPIGLELGYANLGKYNSASEDVRVTSALALLNVDIRGMTIFAKGGVMRWTQIDVMTGNKLNGEDVVFGTGINLAVDRHILFRTELEYFRGVGKDATLNTSGKNMYLLSFGMNFQF